MMFEVVKLSSTQDTVRVWREHACTIPGAGWTRHAHTETWGEHGQPSHDVFRSQHSTSTLWIFFLSLFILQNIKEDSL